MDRASLEKIFADFKPSRKESSNKQYALRLSKVSEDFNKDNPELNDDYLNHPEKVFDYLQNKKGRNDTPLPKSTHANILYSMIEYLDAKGKTELAEKYRKRKEQIDEAIFEQYNSGALSDNQKHQFIPLKELIEMINKLDDIIVCDSFHSDYTDPWTRHELENAQLLFHLYLNYPSRNEYGTLKFLKWNNYRKMRREATIARKKVLDDNYVVMKYDGTMLLSISQYKTADKYGIKETVITDPFVRKLLKARYSSHGETNLFVLPKTKTPWKRHTVSQVLTRWSKELCGKSISSTMIYKIIIHELSLTHKKEIHDENFVKAEEVAEILKKYAAIRGHSKMIQKKCYSVKKEELQDK